MRIHCTTFFLIKSTCKVLHFQNYHLLQVMFLVNWIITEKKTWRYLKESQTDSPLDSLRLFEITVGIKRVQVLTEGRVYKLVLVLEQKHIKSKSSRQRMMYILFFLRSRQIKDNRCFFSTILVLSLTLHVQFYIAYRNDLLTNCGLGHNRYASPGPRKRHNPLAKMSVES